MYQLSVYLHILAAMVWVGGMLFLALVVVPATRGLPLAQRAVIFSVVGRQFRVIGWSAIAVLVVTGIINVGYHGVTWADFFTGRLVQSQFGLILSAKLSLVLVMLVISAIHDFILGPAATRAQQAGGPTPLTDRLRKRASLLARIEMLVALIVVLLAVALVRGLPLA